MNEFHTNFCHKCLAKIRNSPIGYFIIDPTNEIQKNLTFSDIENKLSAGRYVTIYDFSIDMNNMMYDEIDSSQQNSPEYFIRTDFLQQFQKRIMKAPKTENDLKAQKIKKLAKRLKTIINIMSNNRNPIETEASQSKHPSSFSSLIKQSEIDELQNKIDEITDENVLIKVYHILSENIPYLQLDSEVVIDKNQINQKCLKSLKALLL